MSASKQLDAVTLVRRYTKTADWEYINKVATGQDPSMARVPVIGQCWDTCGCTSYLSHGVVR